MSDASHDPGEKSPWGVWMVTLLLLSPVIYVLSIGPDVALVEHGMLPKEPVVALYEPINWLHDNTLLEEPLEWYAALWGWR